MKARVKRLPAEEAEDVDHESLAADGER